MFEHDKFDMYYAKVNNIDGHLNTWNLDTLFMGLDNMYQYSLKNNKEHVLVLIAPCYS